MVLDTTKETICVNQIIGQKTDNLLVEGDIIVPDIKPDILDTINVNGNICIYKKDALDGKVRIDGSINIYIIYLADNEAGEIRGLNTSLDFTQVMDFDQSKAGCSIDDNFVIKTIECKILNGRKINIKAMLDANIKLYSNENIDIVKDVNNVENIQKQEDNLEINSLLGEGNTRVFAKETVIIDNIDDLAEILDVDIRIINKDTKISYNKVLAKADADVKIIYLTEDNRINSVDSKIPVMGFIDMPNVDDSNICNVKYKLKNLIIKPNSTEEHSIYVEAELELSCYVYEKKNISLIQDLYSPRESLNFCKKEIETRCYKDNVKDILVVKEKVLLDDLGSNKIYDSRVEPVIMQQNVKNGKVDYEGEIRITYIYSQDNSDKLMSKSITIPFNFSIETASITSDSAIETCMDVQENTFVILPDNNIEVRINIEFNVDVYKDEKMNIIDEISMEENNEENTYSMVIYFVKPNDTLWNIAKTFKSTVEDIATVNNIENIDKLNVGQQLFIPKYTRKRIA